MLFMQTLTDVFGQQVNKIPDIPAAFIIYFIQIISFYSDVSVFLIIYGARMSCRINEVLSYLILYLSVSHIPVDSLKIIFSSSDLWSLNSQQSFFTQCSSSTSVNRF